MVELSEYVPVNLVCLAALGALLLRRLVRMERFHRTRVVILTGLLWVPAAYLILLAAFGPQLDLDSGRVPSGEERCAYAVTEM
ncbi:MAG TPA: hypothetical protein VF591_27365 [Pyrinomonadaceae bacterium]